VLVGLVLTGGTEQIAEAIAADVPPVQVGDDTLDPPRQHGRRSRSPPRSAPRPSQASPSSSRARAATVISVHRTVTRHQQRFLRGLRLGIIEQFVGDVETVVGDRGAFLRVGLGSLVIWVVDVLTALVVFAAFPGPGTEITASLVAAAFFAVSVGNLAKILPLSPAASGLYEGAFTLIVVGLTTISAPTALAISIVDHAVKNAVTILGGRVSMTWLNVSLTTAVEESRNAGDVEAEPTPQD